MKKSEIIKTGRYWDKAWQLVDGCTKVSPACDNCWSEAMAKRFYTTDMGYIKTVSTDTSKSFIEDVFNWQGRIVLRPDNLDLPLHTRKPTVFSIWNDLFHESVPFGFISDVYEMIAKCPQHTFLVLTKRIEREAEFYRKYVFKPRIDNLWLGCTPTKSEDIATLLSIPAAHHFISLEPMLGEWALDSLTGYHSCIDSLRGNRSESDADGNITTDKCEKLDWVIVGAETGPKARYCPIEWIENVVKQCKAAGVPVWVKAIHKGTADKFKQVHKFAELPESVRVRQSPFIK